MAENIALGIGRQARAPASKPNPFSLSPWLKKLFGRKQPDELPALREQAKFPVQAPVDPVQKKQTPESRDWIEHGDNMIPALLHRCQKGAPSFELRAHVAGVLRAAKEKDLARTPTDAFAKALLDLSVPSSPENVKLFKRFVVSRNAALVYAKLLRDMPIAELPEETVLGGLKAIHLKLRSGEPRSPATEQAIDQFMRSDNAVPAYEIYLTHYASLFFSEMRKNGQEPTKMQKRALNRIAYFLCDVHTPILLSIKKETLGAAIFVVELAADVADCQFHRIISPFLNHPRRHSMRTVPVFEKALEAFVAEQKKAAGQPAQSL